MEVTVHVEGLPPQIVSTQEFDDGALIDGSITVAEHEARKKDREHANKLRLEAATVKSKSAASGSEERFWVFFASRDSEWMPRPWFEPFKTEAEALGGQNTLYQFMSSIGTQFSGIWLYVQGGARHGKRLGFLKGTHQHDGTLAVPEYAHSQTIMLDSSPEAVNPEIIAASQAASASVMEDFHAAESDMAARLHSQLVRPGVESSSAMFV